MGRRRKYGKHLPRRLYERAGTYYYVEKGTGKWINLGRDYGEALAEYGRLVAGSNPRSRKMADLIDRYMREVAPTKAAATYRDNIRQSKLLRAFFGRMAPDDVTARHIYQYMDERGIRSKVQANRDLALLQAVFKKGVRWGDVSVSPVVKIERFKEHPRKRYVQDWEFDAFKSYAGQLIAAYMDFQYLTALRQGDILRVHLNEIKDDGIHVTISKTGKERIITWTPTLRAAVRDARMLPRPVRGMYLFCTRTGSRYTTDGFRSIWQRKMRSALEIGVLRERFTTHDIRAKSASDASDLQRAQDLLGHANNKVTREHYRRLPELVKPLK